MTYFRLVSCTQVRKYMFTRQVPSSWTQITRFYSYNISCQNHSIYAKTLTPTSTEAQKGHRLPLYTTSDFHFPTSDFHFIPTIYPFFISLQGMLHIQQSAILPTMHVKTCMSKFPVEAHEYNALHTYLYI